MLVYYCAKLNTMYVLYDSPLLKTLEKLVS